MGHRIDSGGMKLIQVYAKADAAERVEKLGSSVFLTDLTGWVREATAAEKEAEKASFPGPEPSREEQLEAQVAALQSQVDALLGVSE